MTIEGNDPGGPTPEDRRRARESQIARDDAAARETRAREKHEREQGEIERRQKQRDQERLIAAGVIGDPAEAIMREHSDRPAKGEIVHITALYITVRFDANAFNAPNKTGKIDIPANQVWQRVESTNNRGEIELSLIRERCVSLGQSVKLEYYSNGAPAWLWRIILTD